LPQLSSTTPPESQDHFTKMTLSSDLHAENSRELSRILPALTPTGRNTFYNPKENRSIADRMDEKSQERKSF